MIASFCADRLCEQSFHFFLLFFLPSTHYFLISRRPFSTHREKEQMPARPQNFLLQLLALAPPGNQHPTHINLYINRLPSILLLHHSSCWGDLHLHCFASFLGNRMTWTVSCEAGQVWQKYKIQQLGHFVHAKKKIKNDLVWQQKF